MFPQYWLVEVAVYERTSPTSGWKFYCYCHAWHISPAKAAGHRLYGPTEKPPTGGEETHRV